MVSEDTLNKISDPKLSSIAESDSTKPVSVIVEARLPDPKVHFERDGDGSVARPFEVNVGEEWDDKVDVVLADLQKFLVENLEREPVLLRSAQAFVCEASPAEIRRLVQHPLVQRISVNRRLGSKG